MHVERLQQIKAHILEEPRRLNMSGWIWTNQEGTDWAPPCGTMGCLAGWAMLLFDPHTARQYVQGDTDVMPEDRGAELLELEYEQAKRLFYQTHWPGDLSERYEDAAVARNYPARAQATADRIDRFIATNGED